MKYELVVVADDNDADYQTEIAAIDESDLPMLFKAVEAIKKHNEIRKVDRNHNNWPRAYDGETLHEWYGIDFEGDDPAEEDEFLEDESRSILPEILWFKQFVPYSEFDGIHTIESVSYYPLPEKVKLL